MSALPPLQSAVTRGLPSTRGTLTWTTWGEVRGRGGGGQAPDFPLFFAVWFAVYDCFVHVYVYFPGLTCLACLLWNPRMAQQAVLCGCVADCVPVRPTGLAGMHYADPDTVEMYHKYKADIALHVSKGGGGGLLLPCTACE